MHGWGEAIQKNMLVWPTPGGQKKSHPADRKSIFFAENMQYLQYPSSHWLYMTFATTLFFTTNVRWDHIQQYLPKISAKMLSEIFSVETRLFLAEIFYAEIFSLQNVFRRNFFRPLLVQGSWFSHLLLLL